MYELTKDVNRIDYIRSSEGEINQFVNELFIGYRVRKRFTRG